MDLTLALPTLTLAAGGIAILLGLIIVRENPRQRLNWVLGAMLFCGAVGAAFGAVDFLISREEPKLLQAEAGLLRNFASLWEFIFPTFLLFALVFPRERAPVRRLPALQWLLFLPYLMHLVLSLAGTSTAASFGLAELAGGAAPWSRLLGFFDLGVRLFISLNTELFSLVNLSYIVLAILLLRSALRRSVNARLRGQVQVMLAGMSGCLALYALSVPVPALLNLHLPPVTRVGLTVGGLAVASLSVAYAMVRYRFLDARVIARRSILYGAASGLLLAVYITLLHRVTRMVADRLQIDVEVIQTAFLVIGLLIFHPISERLEDWLEGLLIRDRGDYRTVLRRLAHEVSTVLDLEALARRVIDMLQTSLMVDRALLVVRRSPEQSLEPVASFGIGLEGRAWLGALEDGGWTASELPFLEEALPGAALPAAAASLLAVPLAHGGELLGVLLIGSKLTGGGFHVEDRALLGALGDQLGVAIRNAYLHRESVARSVLEEELRFARRVQQSFMPASSTDVPPLEVSALNLPSKQVGGDYVDTLRLGDEALMVAIGDVSGKGVPAALLMSMTRAALRTQATSRSAPGDILQAMNGLIHESTSPREFVTFFLGRIDRRSLELRYSNGGHDRPILRRRDGRLDHLERGGLLLGAVPDARFEEGRVALAAGDLLVLYTDGLTEAQRSDNGEMYGVERLEACVRRLDPTRPAAEILEQLVRSCRDWAGDGDLGDDMTLLVLRVRDGAAAPLPAEPVAAPRAHRV